MTEKTQDPTKLIKRALSQHDKFRQYKFTVHSEDRGDAILHTFRFTTALPKGAMKEMLSLAKNRLTRSGVPVSSETIEGDIVDAARGVVIYSPQDNELAISYLSGEEAPLVKKAKQRRTPGRLRSYRSPGEWHS